MIDSFYILISRFGLQVAHYASVNVSRIEFIYQAGFSIMDWIAEKLFDLFQDILKGDFTDLEQLPALLILIAGVGCFVSRKTLWKLATKLVAAASDSLRIRKLEKEFKSKEKQLRRAAFRLSEDIQKLEKYKQEFDETKEETLKQVAKLSPPLDLHNQQVLTNRITTLDSRYRSSVDMVDSIQELIDSIANISRAETINQNADAIADRLVSKSRARRRLHDD